MQSRFSIKCWINLWKICLFQLVNQALDLGFEAAPSVIVSVPRTSNRNARSEFPNAVLTLRNSLLRPFWSTFGLFGVDMSGNSEFASAPSMEVTADHGAALFTTTHISLKLLWLTSRYLMIIRIDVHFRMSLELNLVSW